MTQPVAVIGTGLSAAGHGWRRDGWDTWGLSVDPWSPHYDLVFEVHDPALWPIYGMSVDRLNEIGVPVMTRAEHPEVPLSRIYPLHAVIREVGDYFGSSAAYMLGLAILEKRPKIGLWGFDLHGKDGYAHQRPNIEHLLGIARGKGSEIEVAESSALLKLQSDGGRYGEIGGVK